VWRIKSLRKVAPHRGRVRVSDRSRATRIIIAINKIEKKTLPKSDTVKRVPKPIMGNAGRFVVIVMSGITQITSITISRSLLKVSLKTMYWIGETQLQRVPVKRSRMFFDIVRGFRPSYLIGAR
jgi:hypothetical protein